VESGVVYVDGGTVTEANPVVLRDRDKLAQDGVVTCTVVLSKRGRSATVEIASRGVAASTDEMLAAEGQRLVRAQVDKLVGSGAANVDALRRGVRNSLSNQLWSKTHARPMIIPVVMEV
jgi:ribonuclease J